MFVVVVLGPFFPDSPDNRWFKQVRFAWWSDAEGHDQGE